MAIKIEDIDKKISVELSEKIRKHTTSTDRLQVASTKNIEEYELKAVVYREILLRNKHCAALTALIRRAIKNAENASLDVEVLKSYV